MTIALLRLVPIQRLEQRLRADSNGSYICATLGITQKINFWATGIEELPSRYRVIAVRFFASHEFILHK